MLSTKGLSAASCTIRMSIYAAINANTSGVSGLGDSHAWIVIENMGANTITIGTQSLSSGQAVLWDYMEIKLQRVFGII